MRLNQKSLVFFISYCQNKHFQSLSKCNLSLEFPQGSGLRACCGRSIGQLDWAPEVNLHARRDIMRDFSCYKTRLEFRAEKFTIVKLCPKNVAHIARQLQGV